jgi:hypothetical protein
VALARAAALTGDAIETENYYQHAEHYFRLMKDERIGKGADEPDRQQDLAVSKAVTKQAE